MLGDLRKWANIENVEVITLLLFFGLQEGTLFNSHIYFVCVCVCAVCGMLFFPFTIWVPGIKFTLPDLANTFTHWVISPTQFFFFKFSILDIFTFFSSVGSKVQLQSILSLQQPTPNTGPQQCKQWIGANWSKLEQKQLLPYRATVSSVTLDQLFNLSFSFFISTKGSYLLWVTAVRMKYITR